MAVLNTQKKNILKTVAIIVVVMTTILLLFLNKITTPRYLSDIELKINGLILVKEKPQVEMDNKNTWFLISHTEKQTALIASFLSELKPSIQEKTQALSSTEPLALQLSQHIPHNDVIPIINDKNQLIAYIKPPFDQHKMLLTYSSVYTHR